MVCQVWDRPAVYAIPVPLPDNPLKNLNVYLIRTETRDLVIDTGFQRPECRQALWQGLDKLGLRADRAMLFLTHLHTDHTGLVWDFVERGIPVYMSRVEDLYYRQLIARPFSAMDTLFAREGFPPDELRRQRESNQGQRYAPRPGFPVLQVEDGEALPMDLEVRGLLTPGHTPGHMVLYLPKEQLLFSGDHVLFDITPNISVWYEVPHSLSDYIDSLRKTRALPIRRAFPAHRAAGSDVYERIDALIDHHGWRLDEIYQAVRTHPGASAFQIASAIHWSVRAMDWDHFPPHQKWFALSETLAHLYYLTEKGQLRHWEEDGVTRYAPAHEPPFVSVFSGESNPFMGK